MTQGYTCTEKLEQRHKSIVHLDTLSPSLRNTIHHFELKPGYKTMRLTFSEAVINHYKYQAWSEFKVKFRRRVSAYVADWKDSKNPSSQDRVPGLGNEAIEPPGWEHKFCEVNDTALREFTHKVNHGHSFDSQFLRFSKSLALMKFSNLVGKGDLFKIVDHNLFFLNDLLCHTMLPPLIKFSTQNVL